MPFAGISRRLSARVFILTRRAVRPIPWTWKHCSEKNRWNWKSAAAKAALSASLPRGKGGFIDRLSGLHPDVGYLAVERVSNVIVCAAETARERGRENLRFLNVSAENLLYYLPSHKIRAIYLNFSCPYPKKTYANHRLTHPKFLQIYRELLTEDGVIAQKTDNAAFFAYSLRSYSENGFEIMMQTDDIVRDGWENLPTEYENKFVAEGKNIYGAKISLKI